MTDMTLGQRIAECRKRKGLSQEGLGEKLGVSRQAISKWEADGAVPEVDKLIGMSKLFAVSVGWLLGIEEEAAPEHKEVISEELLRKIEEIVLRYRPRKQPMSTKKKVLIGLAAALVLWVGGSWISRWKAESIMLAFTQAQVENINEQNANIQKQLDVLSTRVDEAQFLSVKEYRVDVEPHEALPAAILDFHVVPSYWNDSFKATLTVQYESREILSEDCNWNSSGLHATVQVDVQDGYEYWLVVEYPDGMKNQFLLTDEKAENLKTSFSLDFTMEDGYAEFDLQKGVAEFFDYEVWVDKSPLLLEAKTQIAFKHFEFRLYEREYPNDEMTFLGSHPKYITGGPDLTSVAVGPSPFENAFTLQLQESFNAHSVVYNLTLWVEMSNGLTDEKELGGWWFIDGELHTYSSAIDSVKE